MTIDVFDAQPDPTLARQLEQFESQFRYPLGAGRSFRISHGEDYTRFFRAIGKALCFVAHNDTRVQGVVSVALCELFQPGGTPIMASYFSDLKVDSPTSGRVLLQLLRESVEWSLQHATYSFSVVMEGTSRRPDRYTGRLGIPQYVELAKLMILRVPAATDATVPATSSYCSIDEVKARYHQLSRRTFRTAGGDHKLRSVMQPAGLMLNNGDACGILEDTRRCKLLYSDGEVEMVSAHLSCFGYGSPQSAAMLIQAARQHCRELGIPALFVAVPSSDSRLVVDALATPGIVEALATVYGFGFPTKADWSINTSEI